MWDYSQITFARSSPSRLQLQRAAVKIGQPPTDVAYIQGQHKGLPAAKAISWDHSKVTVHCPFCNRTHNHGNTSFLRHPDGKFVHDDYGRYTYVRPRPETRNTRVSHCQAVEEYVIVFPFEEDERVKGLSFELRQKFDSNSELLEERFCTVGLPSLAAHDEEQSSSDEDELDDLEQELQSATLDDGDYKVVRKFQLEGKLDEFEQPASVLIMSATCTGDTKHIEKLLSSSPNRHALVQKRDEEGLSLLHLAVPNGHHDAVRHLIDWGSNTNVVDKKGRTPLMEAALWGHPTLAVSQKSPFTKKKDRALIRGLLEHSLPTPSLSSISTADLQGAYFHKSPSAGTISLVLPTKAFPAVAAVSGRTGSNHSEFRAPEAGFQMLNDGFTFWEDSYRDGTGRPGSFYASHAEAQLMCFFVKRNYLFRPLEEDEMTGVQDDFLQLFLMQPRNKSAKIAVSKTPCCSCAALRDCIWQKLGIEFVIETLAVK
ncbi:hypothetical protein MY10362_008689 [Beauveria mimosiformis]